MQGRRVGGGGNRALRNSFDATTLFAPSLSIKATFDILKFSIIASLRGQSQTKEMNKPVHSFSLFLSSKTHYHAEF